MTGVGGRVGGERGVRNMDEREARPKKGVQALAGWLVQASMGKVEGTYIYIYVGESCEVK